MLSNLRGSCLEPAAGGLRYFHIAEKAGGLSVPLACLTLPAVGGTQGVGHRVPSPHTRAPRSRGHGGQTLLPRTSRPSTARPQPRSLAFPAACKTPSRSAPVFPPHFRGGRSERGASQSSSPKKRMSEMLRSSDNPNHRPPHLPT